MEANNNTNPSIGTSNNNPSTTEQAKAPAPAPTSVPAPAPVQTQASNLIGKVEVPSYQNCTIQCAIRRKPDLIALPGQDPAERVYKIGASLDGRTKGNLKGISGDLEQKFMPEIVGVSPNDATFRRSIEEYWASISKIVPADEPFLKEHEKGVKIEVTFKLLGKARKERFATLSSVEEKIEYLNKVLLEKNDRDEVLAVLDHDSISDYLLLCYCLKYSKVANSFEDIGKSPKIDFYIFEKAVSVKNQLSLIELRSEAMELYKDLSNNDRKVDAILLMYNETPANFENSIDKLLRIDELYNQAPLDNMKKFVMFAKDSDWETKYLINLAIKLNKLKNPANTTAIYYNDIMLGITINDAVLYLNNDVKGISIKDALLKETQIN